MLRDKKITHNLRFSRNTNSWHYTGVSSKITDEQRSERFFLLILFKYAFPLRGRGANAFRQHNHTEWFIRFKTWQRIQKFVTWLPLVFALVFEICGFSKRISRRQRIERIPSSQVTLLIRHFTTLPRHSHVTSEMSIPRYILKSTLTAISSYACHFSSVPLYHFYSTRISGFFPSLLFF